MNHCSTVLYTLLPNFLKIWSLFLGSSSEPISESELIQISSATTSLRICLTLRNRKDADPVLPPSQHEEWEKTRPNYKDGYISPYVALQSDIKEGIRRPRTAQSNPGNGRLYVGGHLMASSMSNLHDSDFRGVGSSLSGTTATIATGSSLRPGSSLKISRSEVNLRAEYLKKNISATSLATPPASVGDSGLDTAPRPVTAGSIRPSGSPKPSLEISAAELSTPTFGAPPQSPLGPYELASPVKSDTTSLFGDDSPEMIAKEITSRIAREEEMAKTKSVNEERRRVQAELEAQRRRNMEASRTIVAYPSPPASIEGETEKAGMAHAGPKPSPRLQQLPLQERRPGPRGHGPPYGPTGQWPGPRPQVSIATDERPGSRGGRGFKREDPSSSARPPPAAAPATARDAARGGNVRWGDRSQSREAPGPQMLRPQGPKEQQLRVTTASASKQASRSPLFQQMNPFDVHSDEENDSKEPTNVETNAIITAAAHAKDHRAPYGIPSPPLSHRQHPSDEQEESMPILRTVEAKRDTVLVGSPGRASLGLQIEEFERTLQQAQAMSALENKADLNAGLASRSRADSNGSSNYSEMSESPMTIEPPLVSPKPFPLTPRPIGPAGRSKTSLTDTVAPPERPSLEVGSERPFVAIRGEAADLVQPARQPTLEERSESPAGVRPRPRIGAAAVLRRPTFQEYGNVKINTTPALSGRVHRPSPDEYGPVRIKRTESPFRSESSFSVGSSTFRVDSPILKVVRHDVGRSSEDSLGDGSSSCANSTHTSRTNSPVPTGSYSVFSPPQSQPPPAAAVKRAALLPSLSTGPNPLQPEWFGPAPTAPPTSPLPIPDKSVRRKNTLEVATSTPQQSLAATPSSFPLSLACSASIVPDIDANPNWPLPGPSTFVFPPPQPQPQAIQPVVESGFAARRSLLRDKRAPPAPLNIAATKYADEVDFGGADAGPWTPDAVAAPQQQQQQPSSATSLSFGERKILPASSILRPRTAGAGGGGGSKNKNAAHVEAAAFQQSNNDNNINMFPFSTEEDKSSAIGIARGLSIRYDRIREQERRAARGGKGAERMKQKQLAAAWRVDEDTITSTTITTTTTTNNVMTASPTSPTAVEPFDRLWRPNHGLRSPTGIADEQGIRFI